MLVLPFGKYVILYVSRYRRPILETIRVRITLRRPRQRLPGWPTVTLIWPSPIDGAFELALATCGNIAIDPKIVDNSSSFFITSPLFVVVFRPVRRTDFIRLLGST